MDPRPDHGEESYRGSGRLTGRKALLSGALMFTSKATTYIHNLPFLMKMCVLASAGFNMISFHFLTYRSVERWDREVPTPTAARVAGGASILLWVTVVFLGRWIAYVE